MAAAREAAREAGRLDLFGYQSPQVYPALPREVYKWVQSLDLSFPLKNPRRDCANGFLVAELLSRYWPRDLHMASFQNGTSTACKRDNWLQIQGSCGKHSVALRPKLIAAVINEEFGAAQELLEALYHRLTGRTAVKALQVDGQAGKDTAAQSGGLAGLEDIAALLTGAAAISAEQDVHQELVFGEVKQRPVVKHPC